jgi:hypothetical protein
VERAEGCGQHHARHDCRLFDNAACGSWGTDCTGASSSRCTVHNPVTTTKEPIGAPAVLFLLPFGNLLFQLIDKMLDSLLREQFAGLIRHVCLLAQRLELVPLRFCHHRFFHRQIPSCVCG